MSMNRRSFIRYASLAAAGNAAGLRPFGALNALAESAPGYKALVCIFMYGGNDSNNTLVPFNTTANGSNGYTAYSKIRGPLAFSAAACLPWARRRTATMDCIPACPNIQALFNNGNLAFVANVGTLVQPLTRAQYQAGKLATPTNLFSHPDQQLEWQNAAQSGATRTGWAGRIADVMGPNYNPGAQIPLITSVYGDTLFCNGASTRTGGRRSGQWAAGSVRRAGLLRSAGDCAATAYLSTAGSRWCRPTTPSPRTPINT